MKRRATWSGPAFITDIHLDFSRPYSDLPVPDSYTSALGVVRVHGAPVGALHFPVIDGVISGDASGRAIADQLTETIVRHLLADCLITRGLGFITDDPAALFDSPHDEYAGPWPRVTAAVCTRGRPDDLKRCLQALASVDYPSLEILVVDNAPSDPSVANFVRERYPQVRYVCEPRPGLNWARNRAIVEATGEIVAFTDDDAVCERGWIRALIAPFAEDGDVAVTTGLVLPYELETEAQQLFERHGGLGRGFARRLVRVPHGTRTTDVGNPTTFGTGANMAFRRSLFDAVGGFDPALDAGTVASAGGDTEMFFRVLKAGHALVYEPAAVVRHRHRREYEAVRAQMESWLVGVGAALESLSRRFPDERRGLSAFAARLLLLYYPRRLLTAMVDSSLDLGIVTSELRGLLRGRGRYEAARLQAEGVVEQFDAQPWLLPVKARSAHHVDAREKLRLVRIVLDEPLPVEVANPDGADRLQVEIMRATRRIGTIELVTGGAPVSRRRLSEAIVASHFDALTDLGQFRQQLHSLARA